MFSVWSVRRLYNEFQMQPVPVSVQQELATVKFTPPHGKESRVKNQKTSY
jgi:hypothetical protein